MPTKKKQPKYTSKPKTTVYQKKSKVSKGKSRSYSNVWKEGSATYGGTKGTLYTTDTKKSTSKTGSKRSKSKNVSNSYKHYESVGNGIAGVDVLSRTKTKSTPSKSKTVSSSHKNAYGTTKSKYQGTKTKSVLNKKTGNTKTVSKIKSIGLSGNKSVTKKVYKNENLVKSRTKK